ncbi:hypothetical protein PsYK624_133590 [Phanerochaete sordida]|uniref:Uncharacterized protein n=1 Tax=Phanerochaete sordida TaxID=48140 RepID=A0A9P3GKF6_9APHY|nr:hypothetical protein PsYK624_133590 [Phanerochaete sordida]
MPRAATQSSPPSTPPKSGSKQPSTRMPWSQKNRILSNPSSPAPPSPQHAQEKTHSTPLFLPDSPSASTSAKPRKEKVKYRAGFHPKFVPGADIVLRSRSGNSSGLHFATTKMDLKLFCEAILPVSDENAAPLAATTTVSGLPITLVDLSPDGLEGFLCYVFGKPTEKYLANILNLFALIKLVIRLGTWRLPADPLAPAFEEHKVKSERDMAQCCIFVARERWQLGADTAFYVVSGLDQVTFNKRAKNCYPLAHGGIFRNARRTLFYGIKEDIFNFEGDSVTIPALLGYDFIWLKPWTKDGQGNLKTIYLGPSHVPYLVPEWFLAFCRAFVAMVLDRPCWDAAISAKGMAFAHPFVTQASKEYSEDDMEIVCKDLETFVHVIASAVEKKVKSTKVEFPKLPN